MTPVADHARRLGRSLVVLALGLVVGGGATLGLVPAMTPGAGAATCAAAGGVSVVVDYRELGGSTVTACAPGGAGASAASVFASVGVDITYATRQPGFVCRVNAVPASDPCVNASPANAYWGLWWSDGTSGSWTYSSSSVGALSVPDGGSVAWAWQQDRGSSPAAPAVAAPVAAASPTASPTAPSTPSPTGSSSPTGSPSSTPSAPTGGSGGSGGSGGGQGGGAGGSGSGTGGSSPSSSPSASPDAPSTSATPSQGPSAGSSASPEPDDATTDTSRRERAKRERSSGERRDDAGASPEASASADPSASAGSEDGAGATAAPSEAGAPPADQPERVPAAVTWGVVGLLGVALAGSAVVARRRRGA